VVYEPSLVHSLTHVRQLERQQLCVWDSGNVRLVERRVTVDALKQAHAKGAVNLAVGVMTNPPTCSFFYGTKLQ